MVKIAILGSGKGSNCRAILQAVREGRLAATPVAVISDVKNAPILEIAREFGVPHTCLSPGDFRTRLDPGAEAELVRILREANTEFVVLAGFMRILKKAILNAFPRRIINIHPSLLPKFPGLRAWEQALAAREKITGVTVHYVDELIDHGDIIAQREVPVLETDTPDSLHKRIQQAEHALYPEALRQVFAQYASAA
ncbi:MAG: phosphoribosylglycinamide formyltransferase [Verrucomicrobia bacterium]|nr:phosphoribosylglycinamide formyltransferase [Verrucomicrobiota bacterium]